MIGYIYKVTNRINGKIYIGQTIQSIKDRWYRHCGKSGISEAEMRMHLKRAILKYGKENFDVEILEECLQEDLNEREKYYIRYFNSYNDGYNSTEGGQLGFKTYSTDEEKDIQIIEWYEAGFSLRTVAKEFNIDKATVKGILIRHNVGLREARTYKLTSQDRKNIMDDVNKGISRKEIMNKYNISKSYLSQLITGNRRI